MSNKTNKIVELSSVERERTAATLNKKLTVMKLMLGGVRDQKFRGLVISGGHGIGKSYNTLQLLKAHEVENPQTVRVHHFKGHITPLQMYHTMLEYNRENDYIVFDDADACVQNIQCMNLLKAATDMDGLRVVRWGSSSALVKMDHFQFNGRIIILTNHNFKSSPHAAALLDRLQYFRLNLSPQEILILIEDIVKRECNVDAERAETSYQWMLAHANRLKDGISIRTFLKLTDLAAVGDVWELGEVVLEEDLLPAGETA